MWLRLWVARVTQQPLISEVKSFSLKSQGSCFGRPPSNTSLHSTGLASSPTGHTPFSLSPSLPISFEVHQRAEKWRAAGRVLPSSRVGQQFVVLIETLTPPLIWAPLHLHRSLYCIVKRPPYLRSEEHCTFVQEVTACWWWFASATTNNIMKLNLNVQQMKLFAELYWWQQRPDWSDLEYTPAEVLIITLGQPC